jgi:hypothetical protein
MRTVKSKENDKQYIFKVTILADNYFVRSGKNNYKVVNSKVMPWRKIAILGRQSLYKFAESIVNSFDFYFDHCFGFYSNVNSEYYQNSERQYELFADLDDVEPTEAASVKKTRVSAVMSR